MCDIIETGYQYALCYDTTGNFMILFKAWI